MEQNSENDSFFIQDSNDLTTNHHGLQQSRLSSPNTKFFLNSVTNRFVNENKAIDALYLNKETKKMDYNPEFQDYLNTRLDDSDLTIVSFVGHKRTGKSFLVDSLITADNGKVSRVMSRHPKTLVSTTTYNYYNHTDGKIQFFDGCGEIDHETMVWLYYISSVMVFNLGQKESSEQKKFLKELSNILSKIKLEDQAVSKPQLIVVRRNAVELTAKEYDREREFLGKVKDTGLFESNITTINVPFPGNSGVREKQIIDIPLTEFSPKFNEKVKVLEHLIKNARTKYLNGNPMTSKILSFTLYPLTKNINEDKVVTSEKIWDDIVREYSVGYTNIYLKEYIDGLDYQLKDDKSMSELEVNRVLSRARRNADKKTAGFRNLDGDPIFEEYKRQVREKVMQKEEQVRLINHEKIHYENSQICEEAMTKINEKNYKTVIDNYNRSAPYQYHKSDILLDKFDLFMSNGPIGSLESRSDGSLTARFAEADREHLDLDERIRILHEELNSEVVDQDITIIETENKQKEKRIKELEDEYKRLSKSEVKKSSTLKNPQMELLEKQIHEIQKKIKSSEIQRDELRNKKESVVLVRQKQLQKQLQGEHDEALRYKSAVGMPGAPGYLKGRAETGAKDTCCSLM